MANKWLGIDLGDKRIGLAVSDALGMLAHPFRTLFFSKPVILIKELKQIITDEDIYGLVVGIPYTMKGTYSEKTKQVLEMVDFIKEQLSLPVMMIDERLTTKMAETSLHAVGKKSGKNRDIIDQIAAVHILQTYLDSQQREK